MPPTPNARLTSAESGTLDAWIAAGAKASSATCTNEAPKDEVKPLSCKPDTTLKAQKPFTMQANGELDQYVCFGVDINLQKKRHVTNSRAVSERLKRQSSSCFWVSAL